MNPFYTSSLRSLGSTRRFHAHDGPLELARSKQKAQITSPMARIERLVMRLQVAVLVAVLFSSSGLASLMRAVVPSAHVCTCASGGSHAACPVCNPRLASRHHSAIPAFDGVPCGDGRSAIVGSGDVAIVPAMPVELTAVSVRSALSAQQPVAPSDRALEPSTPPPRTSAT